MLPEVTPAVARALAAAAGHARAEGAAAAETVHILCGLLAEEEGSAFLAAAAAGLNHRGLRCARPPVDALPAGESVPLAAKSRAALTLAGFLTREHTGEDAVSGDVLLLALLRTDAPLLADAEAAGLQLALLEQAVLPPAGPPLELDEPLDFTGPAGDAGQARLLDATANRAREGLRVAEDYCRFVLNDALLCGELKDLRHGLTAALASLPAGALLQARDTIGDVGTALSTPAEGERGSTAEVVQANLKRLQEALRSLEEFGKLYSPEFGRLLESLRYRCYTLEKAILGVASARQRLAESRLCLLVTTAQCLGPLEWTVNEAVAGGADLVQLREKTLTDRELLDRARQMRHWTRRANVLFIVNDRADVARLAEADGVHLGQDDLSVHDARRILGADALIGVSTHDLTHLSRAVLDGASYVGVGPTFASGTKDFDELAGLEYLRAAVRATSLPTFAIGGIDATNVGEVVAAGARRVAVSRAILQAESPRAAAMELRRRLGSLQR